VNTEPFGELLPHIDAVNMDIKSIRGEFYRKLCGAKVEPALKSAVLAKNNALLEITNLIIPGENDSDEDLGALAEWVLKNLGADTPVHLSAYFPRYKMRAPATPDETLKRAHGVFSKLLKYVYVGNTNISAGSDTKCAKCGAVLIKRVGYDVNIVGLKGARCASCGSENNIVN
jgi:pyruvate formate lyase activating enzyme